MTKFITATILTVTLAFGAAACGDDDASCEKVVDHTLKIMPPELAKQMGSDKKPLIEKCEKDMSKEQRACVLKAVDMEAMMKCK